MVDSSDPATRAGRATARVAALPGGVDAAAVRLGAGGVAAAATLAVAAVRVLANSPLSLPFVDPATAFDPVRALSLLGCALAAVAVGVVADDALARVGLLAAGVFGALTAVDAAATVPATGVLAAAGVLVAARPASRAALPPRRRLPVGLLAAGLVVSVGVGGGALPASLRPSGTTLALAGLALAPGLGVGRPAWLVGGVAAAAVVAVGTAAPFVSGAVVLVVGAVVGAPLLLVAAGVGGVVALVTDALGRGRPVIVLAGVLLAAGGVPTTVQRGLAVLVALSLLCWHLDTRTTNRPDPTTDHRR